MIAKQAKPVYERRRMPVCMQVFLLHRPAQINYAVKAACVLRGGQGKIMQIEKILNNNVVIVAENGTEKIVMGRGLAYKKKAGDTFDDAMVDKVFTLSSPDTQNKFQELIVDIPLEHVELAEELVSYAKSKIGKELNETIYISLVDHIYTSIVRFLDGITVKNALLWDIRRFYPKEFAVGLHALDMIEEKHKVCLPEDEAGFIALHLVNAEMDEQSIQNMYEITKIMQEISNIVKYRFHLEFDEDSVYYYRFITHLKFFAQRLLSGKTYEDEEDDLFETVKEKYVNSYQCVCAIAEFIWNKYRYRLSNEEKLYLTIHIERVVYKSNS